jgi:hypothetical protein
MARNREQHTADMPINQPSSIDLSFDKPVEHGENIPNIAHDNNLFDAHAAELAFMEEPVTIQINENSSADFPETHVPSYVQGKGAEVLQNGRWMEIGWLPIGPVLTTKRKYVEVLARSKSILVNTRHDDANVERPRNWVDRRVKACYPMSIINDDNPRGHEWIARVMMSN